MKVLKNNVTKIILASLIFPIVLIVVGLAVRKGSANSIWQALGDLLVFVIAYLLNWKYFRQRVYWFNGNKLASQLNTALPAIIIIVFLNSAMFAVPDFKVKLRVIVICLLVGLAEEYIFRGLLVSLFLKLLHNNILGAVIGSSIMFGLLHLINLRSLPIGYVSVQVIFAAALGILFGTIYIKTHNLSIVILLHALRDMFPMFSDKMMAQVSKMTFSIASLYVTVVFLVITLVIANTQLKNFEIQKE
ncbi:CPBP family intramembrane glutamic endopeptidase [Companilactobacillus kimchiensis]|uniref:Immunity protein PlnP n=1 Tax=Companilactobacillus kimchiensis TaxID=993692 RepID=A0A0R2LGV1_9LACO|nr:CPBP family intramembrane glutamic endopeptidase [Companilactobacillus kimchiensis]KRN99254.1 immunity protein PlnP [Companilactobacillus kimchiensis]